MAKPTFLQRSYCRILTFLHIFTLIERNLSEEKWNAITDFHAHYIHRLYLEESNEGKVRQNEEIV